MAGKVFADISFGIEVAGKKKGTKSGSGDLAAGDKAGRPRHPGTNTPTCLTASGTLGSPQGLRGTSKAVQRLAGKEAAKFEAAKEPAGGGGAIPTAGSTSCQLDPNDPQCSRGLGLSPKAHC